jgi:predicted amidohydrolase
VAPTKEHPMSRSTVKVAAVQAAPVFLDLEASLQKALGLLEKAAAEGARLAVFPEAFLPAWPAWVDEVLPGEDQAWHLRLLEESVVVPGPVTERLGAAARETGMDLVIGVNEREEHGGTVYNTILYFDAHGRLLGRHRKLVPTHAERLVWGMGDGSDLRVHQTAVGRVGGLICWENYMPWPASPSTPRASTSGSRRRWRPTTSGWPACATSPARASATSSAWPRRPGSPRSPTASRTATGCGGGSSPTATGCWTATR